MKASTIFALLVIIAAPSHAGAPKKCIAADGSVSYSDGHLCASGGRARIQAGTFSDVRSQTIRAVDRYEYRETEVNKEPAWQREKNPSAPITTRTR